MMDGYMDARLGGQTNLGGKNDLGAGRPDVISKQTYLTELSYAEHYDLSVWIV